MKIYRIIFYCIIHIFAYTFYMNKMGNDHDAGLSLPDPLSGELQRRDFLKTAVVTPALRTSGVQALSQLAKSDVQTVLTLASERIIPNFRSPLALGRLKQIFGYAAENTVGRKTQEILPQLVDYKARERFPGWMLNWAIKQKDVALAIQLFGSMRAKLRNKDAITPEGWERDSYLSQDRRIAEEAITKVGQWFQKIIERIAEEPETAFLVNSCLGECIAIELQERVMPSMHSDIQRIVDRKNLLQLQQGKGQIRYTIHEGNRLIAEALVYDEDGETTSVYEKIAQRIQSDEALGNEVSQFLTDTPVRRHFLDALNQHLSSLAARLPVRQTVTKENMNLDAKKPAEAKKDSETHEATNEEIAKIAQSVQHPFQRVLSQIQLLADPNYVRTWEEKVS